MIYKRNLTVPNKSFFLFGPRGTGKTTWLRSVLPKALWFDLLDTRTFLELNRDPGLLEKRVEAAPDDWVVIDEIQKLPFLLDEVQKILGRRPQRRFALSGSSARKLKRLGTNLLAGRAINRAFPPLTLSEVGFETPVDNLLRWGGLPSVQSDPEFARDVLEAYVANYLKEEIQQEALAKDLGSFSRFLEVAALCNGQLVNVSNIARDAGVQRLTVQRYFDVLSDTLIGVWLTAWEKKAKIKEVSHSKFYFFDPGVVRAIQGLLHEPLERAERGPLLETLVLHELRAWMNVAQTGGTLSFWRTAGGSEIDFVWSRGKTSIGFEIKSATSWKPEHGKAIKQLLEEKVLTAGFGIYLGEHPLQDKSVPVLPYKEFVQRLESNRILPD